MQVRLEGEGNHQLRDAVRGRRRKQEMCVVGHLHVGVQFTSGGLEGGLLSAIRVKRASPRR